MQLIVVLKYGGPVLNLQRISLVCLHRYNYLYNTLRYTYGPVYFFLRCSPNIFCITYKSNSHFVFIWASSSEMCSKGAKIAELFTKAVATTKGFDQNLQKVKVICCGEGKMVTQFQVGPEHLNQRGTLHGGFIAHLVDAISTYALSSNDHIETRGVSIDLSVSYLTAAREGDNIEVEAITLKTGKKIAFLEVQVRNIDKNVLLATGRHTKYIGV